MGDAVTDDEILLAIFKRMIPDSAAGLSLAQSIGTIRDDDNWWVCDVAICLTDEEARAVIRFAESEDAGVIFRDGMAYQDSGAMRMIRGTAVPSNMWTVVPETTEDPVNIDPKPFTAAEHGPELFRPWAAGYVIPHSQLPKPLSDDDQEDDDD